MGWTTGIAVYVVVWWIVIFMVLPWGVETVDDGDVRKGHASGAPKRPRLLAKMAATTVVAAICWGIIYALVELSGISFRQ